MSEFPQLTWANEQLLVQREYQHLATAELRLQQGGVRLAAYLDWLFAPGTGATQ
jgi:hypothetical protein